MEIYKPAKKLGDLPNEVIFIILNKLTAKELLEARHVCRTFLQQATLLCRKRHVRLRHSWHTDINGMAVFDTFNPNTNIIPWSCMRINGIISKYATCLLKPFMQRFSTSLLHVDLADFHEHPESIDTLLSVIPRQPTVSATYTIAGDESLERFTRLVQGFSTSLIKLEISLDSPEAKNYYETFLKLPLLINVTQMKINIEEWIVVGDPHGDTKVSLLSKLYGHDLPNLQTMMIAVRISNPTRGCQLFGSTVFFNVTTLSITGSYTLMDDFSSIFPNARIVTLMCNEIYLRNNWIMKKAVHLRLILTANENVEIETELEACDTLFSSKYLWNIPALKKLEIFLFRINLLDTIRIGAKSDLVKQFASLEKLDYLAFGQISFTKKALARLEAVHGQCVVYDPQTLEDLILVTKDDGTVVGPWYY